MKMIFYLVLLQAAREALKRLRNTPNIEVWTGIGWEQGKVGFRNIVKDLGI